MLGISKMMSPVVPRVFGSLCLFAKKKILCEATLFFYLQNTLNFSNFDFHIAYFRDEGAFENF